MTTSLHIGTTNNVALLRQIVRQFAHAVAAEIARSPAAKAAMSETFGQAFERRQLHDEAREYHENAAPLPSDHDIDDHA